MVSLLILLNAATFGVFILGLYPLIESILIAETLIWLTEATGMFFLMRSMAPRCHSIWLALLVSLIGNLASFLIGAAG